TAAEKEQIKEYCMLCTIRRIIVSDDGTLNVVFDERLKTDERYIDEGRWLLNSVETGFHADLYIKYFLSNYDGPKDETIFWLFFTLATKARETKGYHVPVESIQNVNDYIKNLKDSGITYAKF